MKKNEIIAAQAAELIELKKALDVERIDKQFKVKSLQNQIDEMEFQNKSAAVITTETITDNEIYKSVVWSLLNIMKENMFDNDIENAMNRNRLAELYKNYMKEEYGL